jgi:hypothetical protein
MHYCSISTLLYFLSSGFHYGKILKLMSPWTIIWNNHMSCSFCAIPECLAVEFWRTASLELMAHVCNSSYSGDREWEDQAQSQPRQKINEPLQCQSINWAWWHLPFFSAIQEVKEGVSSSSHTQAKTWVPVWKITIAKKDWGHGLWGRTAV